MQHYSKYKLPIHGYRGHPLELSQADAYLLDSLRGKWHGSVHARVLHEGVGFRHARVRTNQILGKSMGFRHAPQLHAYQGVCTKYRVLPPGMPRVLHGPRQVIPDGRFPVVAH